MRLPRRFLIGGFAAVVLIAVLVLLIDAISPRDATASAMIETFARIRLYASEHASLPASLSVLPRRNGYANQLNDGWGRRLKYEVSSDGIMMLISFGRDGNLGGDGADADIKKAYLSFRSDGSFWVTSELWGVEVEILETSSQPPLSP